MEHQEIVAWLRETNESRLADLWRMADDTRQRHVGGDVHLRGLIEFSNHCVRLCAYCGLRAPNTDLVRYRMSEDEIMVCARQAVDFGYGTLVLQSGEDLGFAAQWVVDLVRRIKEETSLAVVLSLGERAEEELSAWRRAGADSYLLRFETSDQALHNRVHPPRPNHPRERVAILKLLCELGYKVDSGVMIGIPGQTFEGLARDVAIFSELRLDVIDCALYVLHPDTPLGDPDFRPVVPDGEQVPGNELMTHKVIALARLICPDAQILSPGTSPTPQTSACELALVRGANAMTPNLTPSKYRVLYEVFPNRACIVAAPGGSPPCISQSDTNG